MLLFLLILQPSIVFFISSENSGSGSWTGRRRFRHSPYFSHWLKDEIVSCVENYVEKGLNYDLMADV